MKKFIIKNDAACIKRACDKISNRYWKEFCLIATLTDFEISTEARADIRKIDKI